MREYDDCSMRRHNYTRLLIFFFFNDTATTEIYTLSLHDALPICIFCGTGQVAPCKPTVGLGHLYTKTDTCALAGVPGDSSLSGSPLPTVSKAWTQNALSPDASGNATVALTLPHSTGNNQCTAAGVPDACCTGAGTGTCACSIGPCCQYLGGSASLAGSPESLSGYVQLPPLGASTPKAENVAAS